MSGCGAKCVRAIAAPFVCALLVVELHDAGVHWIQKERGWSMRDSCVMLRQ